MASGADTRRPLPARALLALRNVALKRVRHTVQGAKVAWRRYRYRARWTWAGRAAWRTITYLQAPRETGLRRRLAARVASPAVEMPRIQGFRALDPSELPGVDSVLSTCRSLFEAKRALHESEVAEAGSELKVRAVKRGHLRNLLSNDDLRQHPELVDFALSDTALGLATRYLGAVPHLNRVDLLYSVPRDDGQKVTSQLFHVDPEGLTQVKFFINVFEVGEAEGPFTLLPADETARVIRQVGALRAAAGKQDSGRYLDDEIASVGAQDAIVRVAGPAGSGVAVDTSRCLHMGSRVQPGTSRLCFYLQYCSTKERGNALDASRYEGDPVRTLAVSHGARAGGHDVAAPHQMDGDGMA